MHRWLVRVCVADLQLQHAEPFAAIHERDPPGGVGGDDLTSGEGTASHRSLEQVGLAKGAGRGEHAQAFQRVVGDVHLSSCGPQQDPGGVDHATDVGRTVLPSRIQQGAHRPSEQLVIRCLLWRAHVGPSVRSRPILPVLRNPHVTTTFYDEIMKIDLFVDLNTEDESGYSCPCADQASDPSVVKGRQLVVGSGSAVSLAEVIDVGANLPTGIGRSVPYQSGGNGMFIGRRRWS